ncbi:MULTISPECIES: putative polysaccharide biosynthesis protein [Paenibacillus]|uniref:putative polysaccharide biosynthesis protein n=1 Tax=Paenibacillus TaxID=44249 RepID=UPI0022B8F41D|nr:polysaccharide biosynthesis protein [Paenibacillus caseinilyticus]MCZ8523701.1 polysaccharide biosynthesis protein [Paenibacillus caseinilyticus]
MNGGKEPLLPVDVEADSSADPALLPDSAGFPAEGRGALKVRTGLLQGAALLGIAAVVSKLIGTLQKIPLQNLAGDAVFGIYNAVYPLYTLILFLATAGFPLVVSKFVSEHAALRQEEEALRVLRVAACVLTGTGVLCFALLYGGAETIGGWMGLGKTAPAIRSVSFALLIVPVLSVLRGYFQGYGDMAPTALSQVGEQLIRVMTMFGLLLMFLSMDSLPETIAAGATFGSVAGAAAGLVLMLFYWRSRRPGRKVARTGTIRPGGWKADLALARRIAGYAIPLCLGAVALPVLTLVDSFTVPRLLREAGYDETGALYQFGLYNHGQPLVQLVAMIASSMSAALVPAIAAAKRDGDSLLLRQRAGTALRLAWMIGLPAAAGLALLAGPMNLMFYKSTEGTPAMAILSLTALLSVLNIAGSSVLQGLGAVRAPAIYLLLAAGVKAAANALLVPRLGIDGAAWAAVAAHALAGGLALAHALRAAGVPAAGGRGAMKAVLATAFMASGLLAVTHGSAPLLAQPAVAAAPRVAATAVALGGVALGAIAYALAVLRLGAVTAAELEAAPSLVQRPLRLLRRLRLLR